MLGRLGDVLVRRRWWVLVVTLIFVGIAGWLGGGVAQELTGGGFEDPDAESARAAAALDEVFETGDPNVVILVTATGGDVDDPAAAESGMALTSDAQPDGWRQRRGVVLGAGISATAAEQRWVTGPGACPDG